MVALLIRPAALDITNEEKLAVYALLRSWGPMTPDEVASSLKLDETEVELYLANEAGLGNLGYSNGCYLSRD